MGSVPNSFQSISEYLTNNTKIVVALPDSVKFVLESSYDYNLTPGNELIDKQPTKGHTNLYFEGGIEPFVKNGKYGYFDFWGNVVIEPIYNKASPMTTNGYCYVMKNNEYFLIDNQGNRLPFIDLPLHQYKVRNKLN